MEKTRALHAQDGAKPATLFEFADPPLNTFAAAATLTYCNVKPDGVTGVVGGVITLLDSASSITAQIVVTDNNTSPPTPQTINLQPEINTYSYSFDVEAVVSSPPNFTATLTVSITPVIGGGTYPLASTLSCTGTPTVTGMSVQDPQSKMTPPRDYIKIALNRGTDTHSDCDYYYSFGSSGSQPIVGLAVNGTATFNGSQITLPAAPQFDGYLYLFRRAGFSLPGGGACIVFAPGANLTPYVTVTSGQFTWALGPNTFQAAPWDQNQTIDFDFFIETTGQTSAGSVPIRARVTSIPQYYLGDAPTDVYSVPYLTFVWGCLPAGTPIRTVDGDMAVETIGVGARVVTSDGSDLPVTQAWRGWETAPFVRMVAATGRVLVLTEAHPVLTRRGMVVAKNLTVDDQVAEAGGSFAALRSVERIPSDIEVYNLDIGASDEVGQDGATMIANGFVVGDNRSQAAHGQRELERLRAGSGEVPPEWRLDIENGRRRAIGLPLVTAID